MWVAVGVLQQLRSAAPHDGSEQRTYGGAQHGCHGRGPRQWSEVAMGHAVGAPLEFEVGVEWYEEVVVLVW